MQKQIINKTKCLQNCHWVPFMLVSCSWLWDLIRGVINMLRETLLEKTNFSFASGIICRYSGIRASVCFPFSKLSPSWLEPCRSYAVCQSLWVYMCVEDSLSFEPSIPYAFAVFLPPLLHRSLNPEGKGLMEIFDLGMSVPKSLTVFTLPSCGCLCYHPSAAGGNFSNDGWARHLSKKRAECH